MPLQEYDPLRVRPKDLLSANVWMDSQTPQSRNIENALKKHVDQMRTSQQAKRLERVPYLKCLDSQFAVCSNSNRH